VAEYAYLALDSGCSGLLRERSEEELRRKTLLAQCRYSASASQFR
jgi:hypothetical protein